MKTYVRNTGREMHDTESMRLKLVGIPACGRSSDYMPATTQEDITSCIKPGVTETLHVLYIYIYGIKLF
jgi:hypothetical protein